MGTLFAGERLGAFRTEFYRFPEVDGEAIAAGSDVVGGEFEVVAVVVVQVHG